MSDIAIDDVSLSPECFGLNIPPEELNGYNYWNPVVGHSDKRETHPDFKNKTCMLPQGKSCEAYPYIFFFCRL